MPQIHRERVLRAATSSFLARGYRSSVDEIARRAGVAKQTVYQPLPEQGRAFQGGGARPRAARAGRARPAGDLRAGAAALRRSPTASARSARRASRRFRTLVPEVPRFRAHGARDVRRQRRARWCERLAEYLARAMARASCAATTPSSPPRCCLSMLAGIDRREAPLRRASASTKRGAPHRRASSIAFLRAYKP